MALAEDTVDGVPPIRRLQQVLTAIGALALVVAAGWMLKELMGQSPPPKRQVARISILPDTPPPPPPPREEKPPPPREEAKAVVREEQLKQAETSRPANEPIKMEGAAGDGPSAFAAGAVRNEYSGGASATGATSPGTTQGVDRARDRLYASSARQVLRDEIERHLKSEAQQAIAEFTVWVERDGAIQRVELRPTGDDKLDAELRSALDETRRTLRLPPPPPALQPMNFRLTLRPQG
jgi:outer membrane biosynthesis protein TonB